MNMENSQTHTVWGSSLEIGDCVSNPSVGFNKVFCVCVYVWVHNLF